jgi:hypothetical protein
MMRTEDTIAIERACCRLAVDFARYVDNGDYDKAARLFTNDGIFIRRGQMFSGPDAIAASIEEILRARRGDPERPSWRVRHICTNMFVNVIDDNRAFGGSYYSIYHYRGGPVEGAAPVEGASLIGDYADVYVRTSDGWRVAQREARPVFFRPEPSAS